MTDRSPLPDTAVAVVGIGCRFPGAEDAHAFWENLLRGEQAFRPVPRSRWDHRAYFSASQRDVDKTWTPQGAFIDDVASFAALRFGIAPRRLEVMDPQHRLLVDATAAAMQDAGYEARPFDRSRTGVFAGLSVSEYKNIQLARVSAMMIASGEFGPAAASPELRRALMDMTRNVAPMRAFSLAGSLTNMAAASISQTFDLGGPSYTIDAACAAGSAAIADAMIHLRAGLVDVAFAGGAYLNLTPDNLIAFTRVGAISPSGVCRPFDARADGFVQGDGIGMLMLKRYRDAARDGDRVYAVLRGVGVNNDGRGEGPMTPRVDGQLAVLRAAYRDAGVSPASVAYFEAHGTATRVGDPVEVEALGRLLAEAGAREAKPIGSVKANIGHTMSAAGVAALIKALKIVEHRTAPPLAGFEKPHPILGLDRWPLQPSNVAAPLEGAGGPLRVGVSSFGFGGTNVHLVVEEAPPPTRRRAARAESEWPHAVTLSAPTLPMLAAHVQEVAAALGGARLGSATLAEIAWTSLATRALERYALVITAKSKAALAETLAGLTIPTELDRRMTAVSPRATLIDRGEVPARPRVAFLYPGQGAQRTGLGAGLRRRFPAFAESLARLSGAARATLDRPLEALLYPERSGPEADAALARTSACQPALAALSLAITELFSRAKVEPDAALGHSLGEFVALAAGGALSHDAAVELVARRGAAMEALALPDPGAMAAVSASADEVARRITGIDGVVVANKNEPGQVTISGTTPAVERAIAALEGLEHKRLEVSHAFHSPLFSALRPAMERLLADLRLSPPRAAVASCVDASPHDADVERTRSILGSHATSPVDFVRGLAQLDAEVVVQLGAGTALLRFAQRTRPELLTLATQPAEEDHGLEFMRALAVLSALGVPVAFDPLFAEAERGVVDLPRTPLLRERYWAVKDEAQLVPELNHPLPAAGERFGAIDVARAEGTNMKEAPDALVALFAQQAEILRQHAEILAAQNRALLGAAAPPALAAPSPRAHSIPVSFPPPQAAPAPTAVVEAPRAVAPRTVEAQEAAEPKRAPERAQAAAPSAELEARVLEVVAKVSAFPRASLRPEQKLVEELGFDSLMVADLGKSLDAAFPTLGGVPAKLFSPKTTVRDLVEHVARTLAAGPAPKAPKSALEVFVPALVERPTPRGPLHDVRGERWGVLGGAPADELRAELARLGATLAVDGPFDGLVLVEGFEGAEPPARALHRYAQAHRPRRLAVVTRLGGLGLTGADGAAAIARAGLHGYAKSLARERGEDVVRAIDLDPRATAEDAARFAVSELLGPDRAAEIALLEGRRVGVELLRAPIAPGAPIGPRDTVLILGGAGDLGAKTARALAPRGLAGLLLVGRRPADAATARLCEELTRAGTKAEYLAADAAEPGALERALGGRPVTVAIHAAGLAEDAPVERKSLESFDRVLRAKLDTLRAIERLPGLRAVILYSSWAARFGNAAQTDYAAANAALDQWALAPSKTRRLAIDWPPWRASPMVQKIPAGVLAMLEAEGVTFLGDEEGLATALSLLDASITGVVVVGRGLERARARHVRELEISLDAMPYLGDHRLKGEPVLPLAGALDLFVQAGRDALGEGPLTVEGLELLNGVVASSPVRAALTFDLEGERGAATLSAAGAPAYKATVARGTAAPKEPSLPDEPELPRPLTLERFYAAHTFHGPSLRGIRAITRLSKRSVEGVVAPSKIEALMVGAGRESWALDPVAVDSALQLAGYWAFALHGKAGFPTGIARVTVLAPIDAAPLTARVVLREVTDAGFKGDAALWGPDGKLAALFEGVEGRFAAAEATDQVEIVIPREAYAIAEFPEVEALDQRLQMAELIGLKNPYFTLHHGTARNRSIVEGVEMINFSSYNYLGFSGHPSVVKAAEHAIETYGTSVSASRVASGERPIHRALERGIAEHIGVEDAIVLVSGHATNVTTISTLMGPDDVVFHDSLIHESILAGIKASGAARRPFAHGNLDVLERSLQQIRGGYRRALITVEGIYSMDGDVCDLPRLIELKKKYKCLLMVDEAHSIGVLGPQGRGVGHHFPALDPRDVDVWMGTLSKSFASCGGYIAGAAALVRLLKYSAGGFVYSAGITPPNAGAALESLRLMQAHPEIVERLRSNSRRFVALCKARGLDTGLAFGAAVVPVIVGNSLDALKLSAALAGRRINVNPIVYPAVEDDAARLRFFVSATHTEEELSSTADAVAEELARIRRGDAPEHTEQLAK